jgi:glycosyltransferase involved in cell wall biosynthesis
MPCFNVEKYVAEAIESILNQTYGNFELLILDDCSTDRTAEIVKGFADKRIVYHKNKTNLGLSENLNVGIRLAKGEYIARMDGDDVSLPQRLETQINYLNTHPEIGLCSTAMELFSNKNETWIRSQNPEEVKITMLFFSPILHASSMWRKMLFMDNDLFYRQETFPAEDYDLWTRAAFYCQMVNLPDVLYRYRIHGIQVTETNPHTAEKVRQVRQNYIKHALPALNNEDIDYFVTEIASGNGNFSTKEDCLNAKNVIVRFIEANKSANFFDHNLLKYRLKRYWQNRVFDSIKTNKTPDVKLLKELRLKQMIKMILKK